mmetsp:Transcript_19377/g.40361  ORF Transcript_19377/g.40361 Transcript_19377/m.40361 type:complete len:119 (-) Transcript_19377:430-786(-)
MQGCYATLMTFKNTHTGEMSCLKVPETDSCILRAAGGIIKGISYTECGYWTEMTTQDATTVAAFMVQLPDPQITIVSTANRTGAGKISGDGPHRYAMSAQHCQAFTRFHVPNTNSPIK